MSSEHGDLEFKEDELDSAIKGRVRSAPPDDLLDRCLSTIQSNHRATGAVLQEKPTSVPQRARRSLSRFSRWMIAASVAIGAGGAYFYYDYEKRTRNEMSSTLAQAEVAGEAQNRVAAEDAIDAARTSEALPNLAFLPANQDATASVLSGPPAMSRAKSKETTAELVKAQKENQVLEKLRSVDKSAIPFGNDNAGGVRYPDATRREDLSASILLRESTTFDSKVKQEIQPTEVLTEAKGHKSTVGTMGSADADGSGVASGKPLVLKIGSDSVVVAPSDELTEEIRRILENIKKAQSVAEPTNQPNQAREQQLTELKQLLRRSGLLGEVSNTESYTPVVDNPFLAVDKNPLSTFSTDVDTASFANVRRFLNQGAMPPHDAVRVEELINYFSYSYPQPEGPDPFSVNLEVAGCPWNGEHRLVRIGLKGREIADQQRPPANLVFLVDVSGSMQPANKLPLLKNAMKMLVQRLGENERVAIVTYSHELRLVLPSTTCDSKETIIQALDSLQAAGSTNGAGGIQLAYQIAIENFIQGGVNRVLLATDGDFNVGITDRDELTRFIEEKARSGVFLSVLGFGMGNLKDATLERLADRGNGHYAYIDTIDEARKVLVDQLSGTLVTIAKDVKLQVEFNPRTVSAYRLIGYENRVMAAQDFNDDRKDAGEIGAGHTVTALYEIVPAGKSAGLPGIDPLKYQPDPKPAESRRLEDVTRPVDARGELLTVKLRYKQPEGSQSKLLELALTDSGRRYSEASVDFRFASAVAAFGMILRDSPHRGSATLSGVLELAQEGLGPDREGYRSEFIKLVRQAQSIQPR